jgi:uncharacterized protein with von Willebrand factor type A (vWA) domain
MANNLHSLSSVLASKSEKDEKDGLSAKKRSKIVKEAEHGDKFHKKGGESFKGMEDKVEDEGKSAKSAKKITGSIFWKERAKDAKK